MLVDGWGKIGPFTIPAIEIEAAMRQEFWDGHGQLGSSITEIVIKWRKGAYGQPEIAAGWPGYGVEQLSSGGSARNVFWLAFEILRGKVVLPKRAYPDDVLSSVNEENLVQLVVWAEKEESECQR